MISFASQKTTPIPVHPELRRSKATLKHESTIKKNAQATTNEALRQFMLVLIRN